MCRLIDVIFSFFGLIFLSPVFIVLLIITYFETRSPIFVQERVGKDMKPFRLFKFRSLPLNVPNVPTHFLNSFNITPLGRFLRKSKLDELPQLWNVFVGDMSLVGPRPNLFSQEELIAQRKKNRVYSVRPGITGLAQISKIDMSSPKLLAETDARMIEKLNFLYYFKYIFLTVYGKGFGDRIVKN